MLILMILCGLIFTLYVSLLDWRLSIKSVLVIVVIEGVLRKWIFPQASDLVYFLKDIVLLGAYLRYFLFSPNESRQKIQNHYLILLIYLVTMWGLFQTLNPRLGSSIIGFWGMKVYLFYIPLIWIVPNLFRSSNELYTFLRAYLLLVIPVGLLGIAQFFSPASSPLNVYAGGIDPGAAIATGYENQRITGTFSYLSGYSVYLSVCFALLFPIILSGKQSITWQFVSSLQLLLIIANSFMTGARSLILFEILFLVGYVIFGYRHGVNVSALVRRLALPTIISFLIIANTNLAVSYNAYVARVTTTVDDNTLERIISWFAILPFYYQYTGLLGYGIGVTHQAVPMLSRMLYLPYGSPLPPINEAEPGRILLELGPIGMFLWYLLRVSLIFYFWIAIAKLKTPFLSQLTLSIFLTQVILLPAVLVFNHTFSVYYWFLSSFIFLLPHLEYNNTPYPVVKEKC